jgi:hypothetical protein
MKSLLIILIFFSNIVWAAKDNDRTHLRENGSLTYYHYHQLGGDGSLDDPLIEFSEEPKETKIRIINKFKLQQKYREEAEEEMRNFEENDDFYD